MTNLVAVKATRDFSAHKAGDELLLDGDDTEVKRHLNAGLLELSENQPAKAPPPIPEGIATTSAPETKVKTKPKPKTKPATKPTRKGSK